MSLHRGSIAEFAALMESKLVVANPTTAARSVFGSQVYSTAGSTFLAHLMEHTDRTRKTAGLDAAAKITAWIASTSTSAITTHSNIRLPDGSRPPLLSIHYARDEYGVHHTVAIFG